ncbi:sulfurtransferase required for thiamine and 4-thiouridine biosynthesis [Candidatus Regiella insecticola LSR1]|uniref:tRNA sulfurtransferase n=1 Tax=Candidatus Regiella insecticola LSR1 TaxID=663321 RepID=E0WUI6_9ENTR|nr:tRNA uracil 4-sulfurtransferase ThiI [Candidatus Regiella insecticola]EFL91332.1 sulfurtransferase required for thiamine and 4-thiouridine biosynthesis [Candidatus Regiella insecticola LSR1]
MKFIIKLSPEITIKSQSVRLRFIKILSTNIRNILKPCCDSLAVVRHWDYIEVRTKNSAQAPQICDALTRLPGIHHILEVEEHSYKDMQDISAQTLACYHDLLVDKTFCVRVKRRGQHSFSSLEVERYVGARLNQQIKNTKVDLTCPQVTVRLTIDEDQLGLIQDRHQGLGGLPIGTQEDVLSLISGGFDSGVSSYMLMRRGCRVHFCFFNLGGVAHELGVKQVAYHLWHRFSRCHRVRFVSIDFAEVVAEILTKVSDSQRGVVLKRMMIRAATKIAERYKVQAIVTGEALGQVSSQTLTNLHVIDNVSDTLILRPLIAHDKEQIIRLAREIGTEEFAKTMPEYCGVMSKSPTVKAVKAEIEAQESHFDFSLLDRAVSEAKNSDIREIAQQDPSLLPIETVTEMTAGDVLLDIRAPEEQEEKPLDLDPVHILPFYKLRSQFSTLDQSKTYLLYCDRGIMSRLQALDLREQGFTNVKVYQKEKNETPG